MAGAPKRVIDGVLLLDKPSGLSSNGALQQAKRLYRAQKAGHTGSLDPMASGLLPLCFGEATKYSSHGLAADKAYRFRAQLGVITATGDADGAVLQRYPVAPIEPTRLAALLHRFCGPQQQVPPMYSALKHRGQRLYELARRGESVERPARPITIHSLVLEEWGSDWFSCSVRCSKGTYIRTLAEDLGAALECGAHLTALRRTYVGSCSIANAVSLAALEQMSDAERLACLQPVDSLLGHWPPLVLNAPLARAVCYGQTIPVAPAVADGGYRLYCGDRFLGTVEVVAARLSPQRMTGDALRGVSESGAT